MCSSSDNESAVSIYPAEHFNLVNWRDWKKLFTNNQRESDRLVDELEKKSYVVHYWNSKSRRTHIDLRSSVQPLSRLAKKHCPNVARLAGDYLWAFPEAIGPVVGM